MSKVVKSFGASGFLERLRQEYEAGEWDQTAFARHVLDTSGYPMKQPRVSEILRGNARMPLEEVEALAIGLGVSPGYLAFGEGKAQKRTTEPKIDIIRERRQVAPSRTGKTKQGER